MAARGSKTHTAVMARDGDAIDPGAQVGHVHLKVSDLDRAVAFYRDALGFNEQGRVGRSAAFLSAGDYHHHIALNTWQSAGGVRPARGTTGLYYFGIRFPSRAAFATAVGRVIAHDVVINRASDHGVCESVYLEDPDGNGVELYWDRPRSSWPRTIDGRLALIDMPLELHELLADDIRHEPAA